MLRPAQVVRLTVLMLLAAWPAAAHETDQYTIPGDREFADVGPVMSRWIYNVLEKSVAKVNDDIRSELQRDPNADLSALYSNDRMAKTVNSELPWAMDVIEGWERLLRSERMREQYPGKVLCYKEPFDNVYKKAHFILDPRQFFRLFLGSTLKAYGVYFGTDKIGHFTDMGMNYYRSYASALREGKSDDEATRHAIELGTRGLIFSEEGMLGYLSAGAYSNGDLVANYVGLLFYKNLTRPTMLEGQVRPPLIVRDGPYWRLNDHVRKDSDFFAWFISDHYDEALNPSRFESGMRKAVREAVAERSNNILRRYADESGQPRRPEWFTRKAQELMTYWGVDYGHRGTMDELITIADTCFDSQGAPVATYTQYLDLERPVYLAAAGGNPNFVDARGQTALHRFAQLGDTSAQLRLIQRGADPGARDDFGTTPLHLAAGRSDVAAVQVLLRAGAAANARDNFGYTPLHDAARSGSEQVIDALLAAGADPSAKDVYGTTPLHLACRNRHSIAAAALIEHGANVNAANSLGVTPLHEAAAVNSTRCIEVLRSHGANKGAADRRGATPLDLAQARGFDSSINLLEQ